MGKETKKQIISRYGKVISKIYRAINNNSYSIGWGGNRISISGVFASHCHFFIHGTDNSVIIEPGLTRMKNCRIIVKGNNCRILIGRDSNLNDVTLYIEDDGGRIELGKHTTITGKTALAVIEGKSITIGDDCLFSSDITFRVGDSHSILDTTTRERINPSADIAVGNHVWIGHSVKVLKGSLIGNHNIIATGAIVTGKHFSDHCVIGGSPAKVLKEGVDWCAERI